MRVCDICGKPFWNVLTLCVPSEKGLTCSVESYDLCVKHYRAIGNFVLAMQSKEVKNEQQRHTTVDAKG